MRETLATGDASAAQIRDAARLLLSLGDERATVRTQFSAWHTDALDALLQPLEACDESSAGSAVRKASARVLPALVDYYESFVHVFGDDDEQSESTLEW